MELNYDDELDYILEELIMEYENLYKGVKFYTEEDSFSSKENITQKVTEKFGLKEWEVNILYYTLLIDKYVKSVDPLIISLEGLVFRNNGGYVQKKITDEKAKLRIQTIENDFNKYSYYLMIFTAIVAAGTIISAWYFGIEIWRHYH
jgi:hypothetical protein